MNEEKIVKWFYDHEELLLEIMDKKPYQSDGWDYEIEIVKAFLAQQSNEQAEQRLELIGHADLAINNIYIFSGYGEEVPEDRTPIYAGYKNTHPPVPTAQHKEPEQEPKYWLWAEGPYINVSIEKPDFEDAEALYTTPPQRKQLTDDEAFKLIEQDYQMEEYAQAALQLIRRTEDAHGIKE